MMNTRLLPFQVEGDLEHKIFSHPQWRAGLEHGRPRRGHPEGAVKFHIAEVLDNVERFYQHSVDRSRLRLITLVHDTFKYQVDRSRPRCGENHHGMLARRFAEELISDEILLDVIELHDEAFNAWQCGNRDGRWDKAHRRATALMDRLHGGLDLFLAFYRCDNSTRGKQPHSFDWFRHLMHKRQTKISYGGARCVSV